jgi:hypothetical protein
VQTHSISPIRPQASRSPPGLQKRNFVAKIHLHTNANELSLHASA